MRESRLVCFSTSLDREEISDYVYLEDRCLTSMEKERKVRNLRKEFEEQQKKSDKEVKKVIAIKRQDTGKVIGLVYLDCTKLPFSVKLDIEIPNEQLARRYGSEAVYKVVGSLLDEDDVFGVEFNEDNPIICWYIKERGVPSKA